VNSTPRFSLGSIHYFTLPTYVHRSHTNPHNSYLLISRITHTRQRASANIHMQKYTNTNPLAYIGINNVWTTTQCGIKNNRRAHFKDKADGKTLMERSPKNTEL